LHQHPELSNEEFDTTEFLRKEVIRLGLKILPVKCKTGLLVELEGKHSGPTIAIRTDIDALPITEQTGLRFASKRVGRMHACGHDMHMAAVLGAANVLTSLRNELHGKVRFIFQPAEERPPGGAEPMIASGALAGASAIFGLHVDPEVAVGKIGLRDGATMASVYDFDLIVYGRGGHAAHPQLSVDAIATAAEIVDSLQKVVSRETDPIEPVVITIGRINGGVARNVIADEVQLIGTARTLSPLTERQVPLLIKRTAEGVARARGAKCTIVPIARYPVLANVPSINRFLESCFVSMFGARKVIQTRPTMGGEDFACYLKHVPGAMFRLGVMNKKIKADQPWHSPKFIVDEDALLHGTSLLALAALSFDKDGIR
jgi:amidohydrolase